ncbi:MAG: FAD binding domain-containing protein [Dethiobacteria bacterium]
MRLLEFDYFEAENLEDAVAQLKKFNGSCQIIAGGTDLLTALKQRLYTPACLVSLDKIPSLKSIKEENGAIIVGAMCSLEDIISSELIAEKLPALKQAAWEVGSPLLRSLATIGGNICLNTRCRFYNQSSFWRSSRETCFKAGGSVCHVTNKQESCVSTFSADIPPVLIAYGASVRLIGPKGTRLLPLRQFYTANGRFPNEILAGSGEVLKEIEIPTPSSQTNSIYYKFRLRDSIDFPLLGVAVLLILDKGKFCTDARIIITGAGSAPVEAVKARERLLQQELEPELIVTVAQIAASEIHPMRTSLVSPRYKRGVARVVLAEALEKAGGIHK